MFLPSKAVDYHGQGFRLVPQRNGEGKLAVTVIQRVFSVLRINLHFLFLFYVLTRMNGNRTTTGVDLGVSEVEAEMKPQ